ncbi:AAA domain-containing protein [Candidatus Kapaibacterium sp.]
MSFSEHLHLNEILSVLKTENQDNNTAFKKIIKVLTSFYKVKSKDEARVITTNQALIQFINDKYDVSPYLDKAVNQCRYYYNKIRSNEKLFVSIDYIRYAAKISVELIATIDKIELPQEVINYFEQIPDIQLKYKKHFINKKITCTDVKVINNPFFDKDITTPYAEIICEDAEKSFNLKIGFPFVKIVPFMKVGMIFNIFDAEILHEVPLILSTQNGALIVLEPDILVDVTDIANNFGNKDGHKTNFINKFVSEETSIKMSMGTVMNQMFDEIIKNPEITLQEATDKAYKENPISLFLHYEQDKIQFNVMKSSVNEVFEKIKTNLKSYIINEFENAIFSIEPTFISPLYGIQGRLDLLAEYEDDPDRKDIIELKKTKFPALKYTYQVGENSKVPIGVWPNHLAQVICYNLLLETAYPTRKGNSLVFYVDDPVAPLRNVATFPYLVNQIILLRNQIVINDILIENSSNSCFEYILNANQLNAPGYSIDKYRQIAAKYLSMDEDSKNYFEGYVQFLTNEKIYTKKGSELDKNSGFSSLWKLNTSDKLKANKVIPKLKIDYEKSNLSCLLISFILPDEVFNHSFRKGDIVLVYPSDDGENKEIYKNPLIKGVIKNLTKNCIYVSIRNKMINQNILINNDEWIIEADQNDAVDKKVYPKIFEFATGSGKLKKLLFGLRVPEFDQIDDLFFSEDLNLNQIEIINKAIAAKDYYLIQGPPGTGKTSVILKTIVELIARNQEKPILICAYTNRAVDEISSALSRIMPEISYVRVGSKEATDDYEHHLPLIIDKYGLNEGYLRLKKSKVVVSTVASLITNSELFKLKNFDTLIVDEASQILEIHLVSILINVRKFILIGDEKQLPPLVVHNDMLSTQYLKKLGSIQFNSFRDSLFERLLRICETQQNDAVGMLKFQARMHDDIQEFPNKFFYNSMLSPMYEFQMSDIEKFSNQSDCMFERALANHRMIFVNTNKYQNGKTSIIEIDIAVGFIKAIIDKYEISKNTLGVISPFREQCNAISMKIPDNYQDYITVDTVERFQGSEREFIIMSATASNSELLARMQSLSSDKKVDRKLNVAITRAKSHFVLIGNIDTLKKSTIYNSLIEFISKKNALYEYSDFFN